MPPDLVPYIKKETFSSNKLSENYNFISYYSVKNAPFVAYCFPWNTMGKGYVKVFRVFNLKRYVNTAFQNEYLEKELSKKERELELHRTQFQVKCKCSPALTST